LQQCFPTESWESGHFGTGAGALIGFSLARNEDFFVGASEKDPESLVRWSMVG
jgi:hypothetical protein